MIQQGMIQARRRRPTESSPNSVLAVCLRVGRTEIANETVNRQSAALDTGGRTQQQGLGTSGDLGNGDRVQRLLSKQVAGQRVCFFWTFTAGGQLALAFLFMKSQSEPRRL